MTRRSGIYRSFFFTSVLIRVQGYFLSNEKFAILCYLSPKYGILKDNLLYNF